MVVVELRPMEEDDLSLFAEHERRGRTEDPFNFAGFRRADGFARQWAVDGYLGADSGLLVVTTPDGTVIGSVGWHAEQYGPSRASSAYNIGVHLFPVHRGKGYGGPAQALLARYLFDTTLVERVEASTDVDNIAERRALAKAGFVQEGVLRRAQFRSGRWHDLVLFSRLRGDPEPLG